MTKYEVVFEAPIFYSVFVDADDQDEACEKAIDNRYPPAFTVPGFEVPDESDWFVGGVQRVRDDD